MFLNLVKWTLINETVRPPSKKNYFSNVLMSRQTEKKCTPIQQYLLLWKSYKVSNVNWAYEWDNKEHKWYTCTIAEITVA